MTPATSPSLWATFTLANETFAVAVEQVQEVITGHPMTPIPLAPPHICGLVNLRGQIVAAIDLRRRLQLPARQLSDAEQMLVLTTAEGWLAIVVDAIGDVLPIDVSQWHPAPETVPAGQRHLVGRVCPLPGQLVIGLNVAALAEEGPSTAQKGAAP